MARKMKDSGIEWIGEIPEGWEITKLKYLSTFPIEKNAHTDSPYIGLENIESWTGKYVSSDSQYDKSQALAFFENNILFGKLRPYLAKVFCASNDGCCSSEFCILSFSSSVNIRYFWNLLISPTFIDHVTKSTYGTKMPRANTDFIKNICVPVPPRIEQDRIALYLDATSAKIDSLISETRSSIEEYKKLKQAVITQAVTKGVHGNREMKNSGVAWIGEIPKEWGRTKIKMIASFFNGDRTSRYPQPSDFVDSGVAFLTSRNIDSDEVDLSDTKYITEDKYKSLSGAKIQIDDIIFCLRGSVGKCAINRTLSCGTVASSLATIRPKDIYPKYLLYFLLSNIASTQTTIFMNGTCAANLSAENVGNYYITLPISTEQKEIADYLDAKCAEIDKLIAKKEQLVKELESYKKSLIYEVVTGKREV